MGGFTQPATGAERESSWKAIAVGVALVLLVVAVFALLTRTSRPVPAAPPAYAANLKISDLRMSAAENFVGGTVTYLDGKIANLGDQSVIAVTVHVLFKNSLGQVVQTEDLPIHVLQSAGPYPDVVELTQAPLGPVQTKAFRLTLEHISADWNRSLPELKITQVTTK